MSKNLVWQSAPAPANAAEVWEWPCAFYNGPSKKLAALIVSRTGEQCSERALRTGQPLRPLQVIILQYNGKPGKNGEPYRKKLLNQTFEDIHILMGWTEAFLSTHPEWTPAIV